MKYVPFMVIATLLLFFLLASLSTRIPADITNYELELVLENARMEIFNPLLRVGELKDPTSLAVKLRDGQGPLSQYLRGKFSTDTRRLLDEYDVSKPVPEVLQGALIDELNKLILSDHLYQHFAQVTFTGETQKLLNRLFLEESYPREISKNLSNPTKIQEGIMESVKERFETSAKEKLAERQSRRLKYLVAAYLVIWGVLMGYVLYLSHRQTKLKEDIEFLKSLKD